MRGEIGQGFNYLSRQRVRRTETQSVSFEKSHTQVISNEPLEKDMEALEKDIVEYDTMLGEESHSASLSAYQAAMMQWTVSRSGLLKETELEPKFADYEVGSTKLTKAQISEMKMTYLREVPKQSIKFKIDRSY
jgi:hypothetical protein